MPFTFRSTGNDESGFGTHHAAGVIVISALVILVVLNRAFAHVSVGVG